MRLRKYQTSILCFQPTSSKFYRSRQLLIPCTYYLDAAYHICEVLAQLYPEQSAAVGKVVIDTNSDILT
ncbi:hypothetical protein [Nostoc sp.]|uniref:hypothetical protein n=1 Tax=Nostoc sp. TaxID=1180 RepID=UPI002FFBD144